MPKYLNDHRDVFFNLFELLKVQGLSQFGLEEGDLKSMYLEYDKFVENEIFPTREPSDQEGVRLENGNVLVPECLKKASSAFYEAGWFGLGFEENWGGVPISTAFYTACNSASTSANVGFMMYAGLSRANMSVFLEVGSQEQKEKYIPSMISGKWGGTMCLTEPGAGSDVGACRTTAEKKDNGKYKIKGTKIFISSGDSDLYENNIHLVLAKTPGAPEGTKGLSLFIVPKFKINDDGSNGDFNNVRCTKIEHKMGIHASATCELMFGENGECEGELIGKELEGMQNMFIMMNEARLYCGVQGEAQANLAYMMSEQYAKERSQFGSEIIALPDVKRSLLRMRALSRGMRALCYYTGDLFDRAKEDKSLADEIGLLTPICKAYCSEQGFNVAVEAIQVHGGYGYCTEYGIEQFARDTKIATIYEGTNGIQAIDFLMRKTMKDEGTALTSLVHKIAASVKGSHEKLSKEQKLFADVLSSSEKVMKKLGQYAGQKKFDNILQHATDFLLFASQLVVGWRLLESANLALASMDKAQGDDKKYYESKVIDFKVYCSHFLVHNLAIAQTVTDLEEDITSVEFS